MNKLIATQQELMQLLGIDKFRGEKGALLNKPAILSAAIGMSVEASEVLDEMNKVSRPWKPKLDDTSSFRLISEELIDVLFYTLELCSLLGLTGDDIEEMYFAKLNINLARVFERFLPEEREKTLAAALGERTTIKANGQYAAPLRIAKAMITYGGVPAKADADEIYVIIHDPVRYMRKKFNRVFGSSGG